MDLTKQAEVAAPVVAGVAPEVVAAADRVAVAAAVDEVAVGHPEAAEVAAPHEADRDQDQDRDTRVAMKISPTRAVKPMTMSLSCQVAEFSNSTRVATASSEIRRRISSVK